MTPKSVSDFYESKATFRSKLKGLFGKPFSKHKTYKNKSCDLTFDAVPDFPKQGNVNQEKENQNETDPSNNLNYKNSEATQCNEDTKYKPNSSDKEDNSLPSNSEKGHRSFETNSKEHSPILSQTSVVVNGGVGIHFGNVFNNVNNLYYNGCQTNTEHVSRVEKTEAIKDLLKSQSKVEAGHLEFLSTHLGEKWQEIGVTLGLTVGELDCLKSKKKKLKERAFQMLMLWSQKKGADATVGELCKLLWRGKIDTAREAVKQLSLNIDLF